MTTVASIQRKDQETDLSLQDEILDGQNIHTKQVIQPVNAINLTLSTPSKWQNSTRNLIIQHSQSQSLPKLVQKPGNDRYQVKLQEFIQMRDQLVKDTEQSKKYEQLQTVKAQPEQQEQKQGILQQESQQEVKQVKQKRSPREIIPFNIQRVRDASAIMEELKELLPANAKKIMNAYKFDKPQNPFVLRSLDKLRTLDTKQKRFQDKIDNMRDHMAVYEQLQIKPMVVASKKQPQNADLGHLTERTRNELVLLSPKTEDPTFTQTFYVKKELQVKPLAFKNDVVRGSVGHQHMIQPINPEESVLTQPSFMNQTPRLEITEQSKLNRYLRNYQLIEQLKQKLTRNPLSHGQILQSLVKVHLPQVISNLTVYQYQNLLDQILNHGFSQEMVASFEIKDLIRHGLALEDLNLKLQILLYKPNLGAVSSNEAQSQIGSNYFNYRRGSQNRTPRPQNCSADLQVLQKNFIVKRKKAEDNLEQYERAKKTEYGQEDQTQRAKSFLERYIDQNKIHSTVEINSFPSLEAAKKYSNEHSPRMIDSRQIMESIKHAHEERVFRKNKLVLEKFIAERKKKQIEEAMRKSNRSQSELNNYY